MPEPTPALVVDHLAPSLGSALPWIALVGALLAIALPIRTIRAGSPQDRNRSGPVPLLVGAVVAVLAAEYLTGIRGWATITLLVVILVIGLVLLVRSRREASLLEEAHGEPLDQGATARSWCTASLLGFLATVVAGVTLLLVSGGDGFMTMSSILIAVVLSSIVIGDLSANLLLRLRSRVRRAELRPRGPGALLSPGVTVTVLLATAAVTVGGFVVTRGEYLAGGAADCHPSITLGISEAEDTVALGMIGVIAPAIALVGVIGVLVAAARPAIASLEPDADRALRLLSAGRTVGAVLGAQLVLAGDLVPGAAHAVLPVDPALCDPMDTSPDSWAWLPGPYEPGGLLVLAGTVLSVAGVLVWAAVTLRTARRSLTPLRSSRRPSAITSSEAPR
ncbi:hypothetical protein ACFW3Z_03145 [Nocardiopsis alba]|uniref:hypothetical protein n=1 Tax=Nocardiopsis alba TaxID=53437 RepID=UPI0033AEF6A0